MLFWLQLYVYFENRPIFVYWPRHASSQSLQEQPGQYRRDKAPGKGTAAEGNQRLNPLLHRKLLRPADHWPNDGQQPHRPEAGRSSLELLSQPQITTFS